MSTEPFQTPFAGFALPTYTSVPDELFDRLMPDLSLAELRVVLYVCRRTFGFKKRADAISLSQMEHGIVRKDGVRLDRGVGLSKRALLPAIRSLVKRGVIVRIEQVAPNGGSRASLYSLKFQEGGGEASAPPPGEESSPPGGEAPSPFKKQDSTNSSTTTPPDLPREVAGRFYSRLKKQVSPQKLDRGAKEIARLLDGGFSLEDVDFAIAYVADRYPDTQTVTRLAFLMDEAIGERQRRAEAQEVGQRRAEIEAAKAYEQATETEEKRAVREVFDRLPPDERRRWLQKAPQWLHLESSKIGWVLSKFTTVGAERMKTPREE